MDTDRRVWKVTFRDGAWVKMIGFADIERAYEQAGHEFGEFATMESLPETDAAVMSWSSKVAKTERVKAAVLKHTGRKLPDTAVHISQYAFRLFASDSEGICVFSDRVITGEDELYRLGVDMHGMALVATA
ncbi:hypothetical protein [Paraburkholderia sp. RL18-085-BIA-A]|uniref:hypothetical protein n=1 Tax=Paraburkholderia sp. RL18-085-BIA-A TaxID=3031633 RepID=UPI0038BE0AB1